jgi:hypothetical protein
MSRDYRLSANEKFTLALHNISRLLCISDVSALQLDATNTIEEKVPIRMDQPIAERIGRMFTNK